MVEPQARNRRKFLAAARRAPRLKTRAGVGLPPAWLLTDPVRTPDPCAVATGLPAGWGVIYRHFGANDRARIAADLARIARRRDLILLIASDPALAIDVGADGVHWPEANRPARAVRAKATDIITVSAHSRRALSDALSFGADAAFLSTAFPSRSTSAKTPLRARKLRSLAMHARLPCYALGGVNSETADAIAPFAGLASIEGILDAFSTKPGA
ncbi:MAG: thiamine phosphate synthase [Pseudomonadota bacterium]